MANATSLSKLFGEGQTQPETFEYNNITINQTYQTVHVRDRLVQLEYKEFQLLWILMENQGNVVRNHQIKEHLWGEEYVPVEFVHAYMERLKFKLGEDAASLIVEIPAIGFRIEKKSENEISPRYETDFMKFRLLFRHY